MMDNVDEFGQKFEEYLQPDYIWTCWFKSGKYVVRMVMPKHILHYNDKSSEQGIGWESR